MAIADFESRIIALEVSQRRAELIAQINAALSSATDEQGILTAVASLAEQNGVAGSALAYVRTDADGQVTGAKVVALQIGGQPVSVKDVLETDDYPLDANPILGIALENPDEPLFVENVFTDPRTEDGYTREAFRYTNMAATVILWFKAAGRVQGVMTFNWPNEQPFNDEVRAVFKAIQPVAAAVIANRRLMLELEQAVEQRTAALRESETRLAQAQKVGGIGIWELDMQALQVYWSDTMFDITGRDPARGTPGGSEYMEIVHPDDRAFVEETIGQAGQTGVPFKVDYRVVADDGTVRYVTTTGFATVNEQTKSLKFVGTMQDMTERRQAEAERERLQQQIIEAQKQALAELSTPIIPIMDRIIVMPLVGAIDTGRSRDIMRSLLEGISLYRAQIAILDITGVPIVDSGVADHLNRTMQAARLKGAQTIITGVSDAVAETIVDLGIDWSAFETLRDLQTGLVTALERVGFQLVQQSVNGKHKSA